MSRGRARYVWIPIALAPMSLLVFSALARLERAGGIPIQPSIPAMMKK